MGKKDIHIQSPFFKFEPLMLYAGDERIRYQASSGGVVSSIIKYLFEKNVIQNTISYEFNKYTLFNPKLIKSYEEYQIVGSIYHDIRLIKFIKDNVMNINGKILVVCLPCQVKSIKKILEQGGIEYVIIALTCSAQMSKEATWFLLKKFNIKPQDIELFRYRGNGWPSGVQIKTMTKEYFFDNTRSIWTYIFQSYLFTMKRCFSCPDTFGLEADISVADPWFKKRILADPIGTTLVLRHTNAGNELIQKALQSGVLKLEESVTSQQVIKSQEWTLKKKYIFKKYRALLNPALKMIRSRKYTSVILPLSLIKLHTKILNLVLGILLKLEKFR
jgi:coenzyme F420-reducing hydrogenase beta subunit